MDYSASDDTWDHITPQTKGRTIPGSFFSGKKNCQVFRHFDTTDPTYHQNQNDPLTTPGSQSLSVKVERLGCPNLKMECQFEKVTGILGGG